MTEKTKAAWFLDADFTPTSTLIERLRKPERVVVNEAGFTMFFSSSDKMEAADRIEKLEAALRDTLCFVETYSHRWDGLNGRHPFGLVEDARKALEGKDD